MKITGLHLEPTNICTLKCLGCARTRFIQQWPQHWRNHSIDVQALNNFLDVELRDNWITLCGNYGDPIYHPELVSLVNMLKSKGCSIKIVTNGSHKKREWWQELCQALTEHDQIYFSIDGMPHDFMQYRENADWLSIQTAIETCRDNKISTVWKFIPFRFNQHEIEQARDLSKQLGMTDFIVEPSDRFDQQTEHLVPERALLGPRWSAQQLIKNQSQSRYGVNPKCAGGNQHFITAEGFYVPCCFVADHRFYHKTFYSKQKTQFDIRLTSLSQLLTLPQVVEFYQDLPTNAHIACRYNCPDSG